MSNLSNHVTWYPSPSCVALNSQKWMLPSITYVSTKLARKIYNNWRLAHFRLVADALSELRVPPILLYPFVPYGVFEQVRYALRLPDYDELKRLNDLEDEGMNLVIPGETYIVPGTGIPRPPAGWHTSLGVRYFELDTAVVTMASQTYIAPTPPSSQHRNSESTRTRESPPHESQDHDKSPSSPRPVATVETTIGTKKTTTTSEVSQESETESSRTTTRSSESLDTTSTSSTASAQPTPTCYKYAQVATGKDVGDHSEHFCSRYRNLELSGARDYVAASYISDSGALHAFSLSWQGDCKKSSQKIDARRCPAIMRDNYELCES